MELLPRPVMMMIWSQPAARASSTPYWMMGLSTRGNISLGIALGAGRKRVPRPAAGKTAFRTFIVVGMLACRLLEDSCQMRVQQLRLSAALEQTGHDHATESGYRCQASADESLSLA